MFQDFIAYVVNFLISKPGAPTASQRVAVGMCLAYSGLLKLLS